MLTLSLPVAASAMPRGRFQLRFESLFNQGRGLAFPCDERGEVELDTLSERARSNYLYARAVVGREFATPAVVLGDDDQVF
ncbi:MAG: hypothetical protein KGM91_15945 [Burkholderiales bacterium]|nr:hypothetical protein [Burkholderiales bacterium]